MARFAAAIFVSLWLAWTAGAAGVDAPVVFLEGVPQESGLATLLRTESVRAHEEMSAWYGVSLDRPLTVRWIVEGEEMERRTGIEAGGVAGAARADRNEILLFAPALVSRPERIVPVLRHEMSHLVFARATSAAELEPPRWLDEGIAMWRSGEWDLDLAVRRDRAAWLRDAAAAGQLFAFEELDGRFPRGPRLPLAYAQSASFVDWLDRRSGGEVLRRFIADLGRDADLEVAARAAFGASLETLESEWREDVAGGFLGRLPSEGALLSAACGLFALLLVATWVRKRRKLRRLPDDEGPPAVSEPSGLAEGSSSRNLASTPDRDRG